MEVEQAEYFLRLSNLRKEHLMVTNLTLNSANIYLRTIDLEDCTPTYVNWLNDPEVNQYLETKWNEQTLESIRDFVNLQIKSVNSILFAIILGRDNRHIGNIKVGPINEHYRTADISYFIGDKALWGKGIATEAIGLVSDFSFEELELHKCEAGAYSVANGSWKAL